MLSLGMVIGAIFNQGKSLINGQHSNSAYMKQLEVVSQMEKNYKIETFEFSSKLKIYTVY